ncbi:MAG: substrate-binding domain-containing protein [Gallicola sp.]|nr:substrate-binding domain-containing protein [Gallicola sp.]
MKKRWTGLFSIVLLMAFVLTACGGGGEKTAPADDKAKPAEGDTIVVEVLAKGFQHQFWKAVNQGADQAAKDLNATITFQGPPNETAIQEQVQMLANAINKKPNAIAFAALDTTASLDLLAQAKSAGIPVVGFDSGVPGAPEGTIAATAATDNEAAAAIAAEKMYPEIKDKIEAATPEAPVRIGVVSQEVNSASLVGRTKGFIDKMSELAKAAPNIGEKVAIVGNDKFMNGVAENEAAVIIDLAVPAKVTDADGQTQAQTLLNKADLVGIFGSNEFGAKSIINADNAVGGKVGKGKIVAVGFDSGALQIDAVKKGQLFGAVTQDPIQIGYKAVELAVKAAKGEAVTDVDTGAVWYDSSNVDSEEVKALLYE